MKIHLKIFTLLPAAILMLASCSGCPSKKADPYWSNSKSEGDIPNTPLAGKINNKDTTITYVKAEKWTDDYSITFSNQKPDNPCGIMLGNDAVNFRTKILQEGTFEKKMDQNVNFDDYHSYYHYNQEDGVPMSINTDWAAKVVLKEFNKKDKKIRGWAKVDFKDGKTSISGSFEGDYCE